MFERLFNRLVILDGCWAPLATGGSLLAALEDGSLRHYHLAPLSASFARGDMVEALKGGALASFVKIGIYMPLLWTGQLIMGCTRGGVVEALEGEPLMLHFVSHVVMNRVQRVTCIARGDMVEALKGGELPD